jgi:filamentous hemagglutinin family protein
MTRVSNRAFAFRRNLVATAVACCFSAGSALANPVGPTVVNGQVSFATSGKTLSVTNSPGSIISWQGFSIGAGETTRFIQQNAASAVLNRVVGSQGSSILGALQSNGRVYLINPNGIIFGSGAMVDTAGLVASTLNMLDADFLTGRLRFQNTPGAGIVSNAGEIRTPIGGRVMLISPSGVENSGIIHSPKGEVILAAGKSVEITDSSNPEVRIEVAAPEARAINLGTIVADAGKVGIYGGIVANHGIVSANSAVVGENGKIVFKSTRETNLAAGSVTSASGPAGGDVEISSTSGTTMVAGSVQATGSAGAGGNVRVLGENVGLTAAATIDASGARGGGTVLVGGDYQGANPSIQNARMTYAGSGTSIKADALAAGDGGKVILWADDTTRSHGAISARGGAQSGNGGFVETSGKLGLNVTRGPDVRAPAGNNGTWLIDPNNIDIVAGQTFDETVNSGAPFFAPLVDGSVIGVDLINAQLDFGSNVLITTTSRGATAGTDPGNITLSAPILKRAETQPGGPFIGTTSLTLQAHNNIVIAPGASITSTGDPLNVTLTANSDNAGGGGVTMGGAITTRGGSVNITGTDAISVTGAINTLNSQGTFGGQVQVTSSANTTTITAPIVSGSFVQINGQTGTTISAPVSSLSSIQSTSNAGKVTVSSNVTSSSSVSLTGRSGVQVTGGAQIATGAFSTFNATVSDPTSASSLDIDAGSVITSRGATLTADNMNIQGIVNADGGSVTLRQNTAGRAINLGTEVAGALSLTQAELDNVQTTSSYTIGNSASGAVTIAGPINATLPSSVFVNSGTSINNTAAVSVTGSLTVDAPSVTVGAPVSSAAVNSVLIRTDALALNSSVTSAGSFDITARTGVPINLGTEVAGRLSLTQAELDNLTAGTRLKFNTPGQIFLDAPLTLNPAKVSTLSLSSSNQITQSGGALTVQSLALSGRTLIDFQQDNDVTNLAAQITCCNAGNINFVSKPSKLVNVTSVDGISGISTTNFSGNSSILVKSDDLNITALIRPNIGDVTLTPRSGGLTATLGADTGGTLGLTIGELSQVQATKLTIAADRMDIVAPVTFAAPTTILGPATANRSVSIVTGAKSAPGELQFLDTEFANIAAGTVVIGGPTAGPVAVNAATTIPASLSAFVLQSGDTATGITIAPSADLIATNTIGLTADTMNIGALVKSTNAGLVIATNNPARNIDIGTDPGGSLGFSTTELGQLRTAGSSTVLFTNGSGNIGVTGAVAFNPGDIGGLALDAGNTLAVNLSSSLSVPGPISLRAPTININTGAPVTASAAGNVSLTGNAVNVSAAVTATAGDINVSPRTFSNITLGTEVGGSLSLTDPELNNLVAAAGVLRIGDISGFTGNITLTAPITLPANRTLSLKTDFGNVTQNAGATITIPNGNLAIEASDLITMNQQNQVSKVALASYNDTVTFTRAPGAVTAAPLTVGQVDDIFGAQAGSGGSPLTITADQINVDTTNPNVFLRGSTISLLPSATLPIDIGTKAGTNFGFTQAELSRMSADSVTIGNALSGNVTVSQPISISSFNDLSLVTGGTPRTIAVNAALTVPGNLTLTGGSIANTGLLTSSFGNVTLIGDALSIGNTVTASNMITARPLAVPTMDLGGADTVNQLGIDAGEFGNLMAPALTFGNTSTINITQPLMTTAAVALVTNDLTIAGGASLSAPAGVAVTTVTAGRTIDLGTAGVGTFMGLDAATISRITTNSLSFTAGGASTINISDPAVVFPGQSLALNAGTITVNQSLTAPDALALRADTMTIAGGMTVSSAANGTISVAPRSGNMTVGGPLIDNAKINQIATAGTLQLGDTATTSSLSITAPINTSAFGALALIATNNISQTAGSMITSNALRAQSSNGSVTLTENNAVGTLAGTNGSFGSFSFTNAGPLSIGTVGMTNGIVANSGTVTLRADNLDITTPISANNVTLAPRLANSSIDLGGNGGGLGLTNTEINQVSASTLNIGANNSTGIINVTAAIDRNAGGNLNLITQAGGTINVNAALGSSNVSNLQLNTGLGGTINTTAPLQASSFITGTGNTFNINAPITSDFSTITLQPTGAATGTSATINGAISALSTITVSADTIAINAPVTSQFGNVNLNAFSNAAGSSVTVNQQVTANSSINITTNTININAPLVTTGSTVTLQPKSAGVPISVGLETAGQFSVSVAELGLINTDSLIIGNNTAGVLTVNAPIGPFVYDFLSLRSGGNVTQTAGSTITVRNVNPLNPLLVTGALDVQSGGKIILPENNNIAVSVSGSAAGTGNNFEFNNISPLKLQNVTGVFATGKVLISAPPGSLVLAGGGTEGPADIISSILKAQDTQNAADEEAEERKEEKRKAEEEKAKKEGKESKACS